MRILYNSWKRAFKTPFGAVRQEESCRIEIRVPRRCAAMTVSLLLEPDGAPPSRISMAWIDLDEEGYDRYAATFSLPGCGLYFYYFEIEEPDNRYFLYRHKKTETNISEGEKWQLTCFSKDYQPPKGLAGSVMYQIFPDRFYHETPCDTSEKLRPFTLHQSVSECPCYLPDEKGVIQNNDFYGGNLEGIRKKIPYLKELGIDILYLNPIFMAYSNHRYDTADYLRIDPLLGTEADFRKLCREAHKNDIKIILDGVFSHTGSNSVYFDKEGVFGNGAYHNPNSPYREWFDFQIYPEKYTSWWGIETLPCVAEENPGYMDFIIGRKDSVIAHWLECGADGFRLDVADELPDGFIQALTKRAKELNPEAVIIGEVWEDASNKISYGKRRTYFSAPSGVELDSVMNYPFRDAVIGVITGRETPLSFQKQILSIAENYPKPVLHGLMNSLSTHDTPRLLSLLGQDASRMTRDEKAVFRLDKESFSLAVKRMKAAVFLQFFLPGIPCIYYGEEAGMEGFEDPFNRGYFPWNEMHPEIFDFYRQMIRLHRLLPPLAEIRFWEEPQEQCVVFHRGDYTVICNPKSSGCHMETGYLRPVYLQAAEKKEHMLYLESYGFALMKRP